MAGTVRAAKATCRIKGEGLYRRSLYTYWKRTVAPPSMVTFDSPNRETCAVRENRTNTPLQALNLMNDVTYLEAARKLAERMMTEGGATRAVGSRTAYALVLARAPRQRRASKCSDARSTSSRRTTARDPEAAAKFLQPGRFAARSGELDAAELAAYTRRREPAC